MATKQRKPIIRYGTGLKKQRARYDFNKLKKAGDFFEIVDKDANWGSIRAQASKQQKRRGVLYSVNYVAIAPISKKPGIVVRFEKYIT